MSSFDGTLNGAYVHDYPAWVTWVTLRHPRELRVARAFTFTVLDAARRAGAPVDHDGVLIPGITVRHPDGTLTPSER